MYEADAEQRGVYRISPLANCFSAVKRVLADAVPDPGEPFWEEYGRLDAEYRHARRRAPFGDGDAENADGGFEQMVAAFRDAMGRLWEQCARGAVPQDEAAHGESAQGDSANDDAHDGPHDSTQSDAANDAAQGDAARDGSQRDAASGASAQAGAAQGDSPAGGGEATPAVRREEVQVSAEEPSADEQGDGGLREEASAARLSAERTAGGGASAETPGEAASPDARPAATEPAAEQPGVGSFAEPSSFEGLCGQRLWSTVPFGDGEPEQDVRARAFAGSYGWLGGVFPAPDEDGRYLVEFIDRTHVRMLGYFDRAGRVWLTDAPLEETPERSPQMDFARFSDCSDPDAELGCVEVREPDGTVRQVARYRRPGDGRIALYATWYDFGAHADGLTYDDAVARCFFAFCFRPGVIGAPVPTRGLVPAALVRIVSLARAFRIIVGTARLAECDAALVVPGAYGMLADELEEAGALGLADDAPLALVREARSGMLEIVVMAQDEEAHLAPAKAMALELALNRYRLVCDELGERADVADRATAEGVAAGIVDRLVPERFAISADDQLHADAAGTPAPRGGATCAESAGDASSPAVVCAEPEDDAQPSASCAAKPSSPAAACAADAVADQLFSGEWNMRVDLACAIESLRTPYRGAFLFKSSLAEGCAVLSAIVPPGAALPTHRWDAAAGARVRMTADERADEALRYALRYAVVAISKTFASAPQIARIRYESGYHRADAERPKEVEGCPRAVEVTVDRARFMDAPDPGTDLDALLSLWSWLGGTAHRSFDGADELERADATESAAAAAPAAVDGDRAGGFPAEEEPAQLERRFDPTGAFEPFLERPAIEELLDRPEAASGAIPQQLRSRLGASRIEDLRITASSARRRDAERLADALVGSTSDTDAVRRVRAFQDQANDPYASRACARVMTALLEGNLDLGDQNAVVNRYLGSDVCMRALALARDLRHDDQQAAVEVLTQAIAAAEAQRAFTDTPEVACRVFDGYASRLLYNLDRAGTLPLGPDGSFIAAADRGRTVELVSDALYLCALEAERLMEGSFSDAEAAIGYGKRAIELAPTAAMGYRQLARSYMLVGDAESSIAELERALHVGTQVADVAISYYQLAYVLGQERRLQAAVACYVKAIDLAPTPFIRRQAMLEMRDLLEREGAVKVPLEEVDHVLEAEGIVVAPTDAVLDALFEGAKAATDAGLFPCASSLLGTYLRYRPDAALVDVLRSLAVDQA